MYTCFMYENRKYNVNSFIGHSVVLQYVNNFGRLCEVNLRIHGTISASKLIFDSRDKQENICSELSKLGLA